MAESDFDLLARPRQTRAPAGRGGLFAGVKLALLAAVAVVVASLILHLLPDMPDGEENGLAGASRGEQTSDRMEKPVLTRTDAKGRLFTVSAASATRTSANSEAVSLQEVRADAAFDSPFQADDRLFLSAASALLRGDVERLDLFAPMRITTASDYLMQAEWVGVDLKQSRIEEGRAVSLSGPAASLQAETMSTSADGNLLTFRGNVRVRWRAAPTLAPQPEPL